MSNKSIPKAKKPPAPEEVAEQLSRVRGWLIGLREDGSAYVGWYNTSNSLNAGDDTIRVLEAEPVEAELARLREENDALRQASKKIRPARAKKPAKKQAPKKSAIKPWPLGFLLSK